MASSATVARAGRLRGLSAASAPSPVVRSVAVVGAGVGGLAAARALALRGVDVHVYEQADAFSPTAGAGFKIQPNGAACLRALGLGSVLPTLVNPLRHMTLVGRDGRELASSDAFSSLAAKYPGLPFGGALRADLIEALAAPLAAEGRLHHGSRVTRVEQDAHAVRLTLASGGSAEAELLIGADGVHSTAADAVDSALAEAAKESARTPAQRARAPEPSDPAVVHDYIFYGVIDHPASAPFGHGRLGAAHTLLEDLSGGREFISYALGTRPDGAPKALMWALSHREVGRAAALADEGFEWRNTRAAGREAARMLSDHLGRAGLPEGHPVFEAAERTADERLSHFEVLQRAHRATWHAGRVCLLGDAAHATLPYAAQGANMALEDGLVLAAALCAEPVGVGRRGSGPAGSVEEALQAFVRARHARTKSVVDRAIANSAAIRSRSGALDAVRDALLGAVVNGGLVGRALEDLIDGCPVPLTEG